jgi:uridine monophosphate synthetase
MATKKTTKEKLILELYKIGAIKFGQFTLKSGEISPYYIDLRFLCSYPRVLKNIASAFAKVLSGLKYDLIVGVPYTSIALATAVALLFNKRMIFTRKEVKKYGTKKQIEGIFKSKEKAVIIDDVISDGTTKFEMVKILEDEGLRVKDIIVLVDRGQGAPTVLRAKGYHCHAVVDIYDILSILLKYKKITPAQVKEAKEFLAASLKKTKQ